MELIVLATLIGVLVGLVVGTLGAGGGVLTVPALAYLVGFAPHDAATASLVIVGVTSFITLVPHAQRGNVRWGGGLAFGLLGAVAAVGGAWLAHLLAGPVLMALFSVLLLAVAALMVRKAAAERRELLQARREEAAEGAREAAVEGGAESEAETEGVDDDSALDEAALEVSRWDAGAELAEGAVEAADAEDEARATGAGTTPHRDTPHRGAPVPADHAVNPLLLVLTAGAVGLLTGLFGVGGGFAAVPALILVLRYPVRAAVGTSLLVIVVNSAAGLAARIPEGLDLQWVPVICFAAASTIAGQVGARLSGRVSTATLTAIFAGLLAIVAVLTATQSIPELLG